MTIGDAQAPAQELAPPRTIDIVDPRDGTPAGRHRIADDAALERVVDRAVLAASPWAAMAPADLARRLVEAAGELAAHVHELAELNARETGRPEEEAVGGILAAVDTLRQYAELGPLHRGDRLRGAPGAIDYSVHEPRGVVAVLTPWNDPVAVAVGLIGAALVTGNTVIHKPSERSPGLGARLGEILSPSFPAGVLQTVTGDGATGAALIRVPGVDAIAHVGSSAAGEAIALSAGETGAHVVRENGGNDALIVDSDVDPAWAAAQAAIGAFTNAGQLCTAVERIFVLDAVADEFLDALVVEAESLNESGRLGPLVDERLRSEVHRQVADAVDHGAVALTGGAPAPGEGTYYPATVVVGCAPSMSLMTEETFGPIAPVRVVATFDDALEAAASDRYGLSATVLTDSMAHAMRAIERLPVGTVKVNAVFGGAPGGSAEPRGASGRGFGYGPALLDEFVTTKVVHLGVAEARS